MREWIAIVHRINRTFSDAPPQEHISKEPSLATQLTPHRAILRVVPTGTDRNTSMRCGIGKSIGIHTIRHTPPSEIIGVIVDIGWAVGDAGLSGVVGEGPGIGWAGGDTRPGGVIPEGLRRGGTYGYTEAGGVVGVGARGAGGGAHSRGVYGPHRRGSRAGRYASTGGGVGVGEWGGWALINAGLADVVRE